MVENIFDKFRSQCPTVIHSGYCQFIPQASLYLPLTSGLCCLSSNGYTDVLIAGTF